MALIAQVQVKGTNYTIEAAKVTAAASDKGKFLKVNNSGESSWEFPVTDINGYTGKFTTGLGIRTLSGSTVTLLGATGVGVYKYNDSRTSFPTLTLSFVKCTKAEYNSLATKDPNTLYIITPS